MYRTLWGEKISLALHSNSCNEHATRWATEAIDLVVIFALLTYIENEKNARKNKINTDPNPTTNPNPKPTIHKAAKRN